MDLERLGVKEGVKLTEEQYNDVLEKLFLSKKISLLKAIVFKRDIAQHLISRPDQSLTDPYTATD
ncbi:hypothetical protein TTHERM_00522940 (macronuclear) [Tetrahymena thermophila SB210]|uniref:Uncharacterized protein n=1 Tax=Tetrahymena thermophila (strain SB210) TaxID=312017 RepID=I7M7M5_TETTS|nr:hypothetical protein TTHERM_00522940 [Tetrahymena thermophila SB210]EAR94227.1 hypothetical protein TTHERM_00522940 [Tetrahymena thermophila SB210]|eukprot:XP_001014472.1 hypothetical protein TTHERM_00522940 [Tetrahymena thermophila SB210]